MKRKIVFCPLNGTLRVAGLAELGARDVQVDSKRLADLKRGAQDSLPQAADFAAMNAGWAGLRPMTANSLPIIKRVSPGVDICDGVGRTGQPTGDGGCGMIRMIGKWARSGALYLAAFSLLAAPVLAQKKQLLEYPSIHSPVVGEQGMVVSQNAIASRVGAGILRRGGNAVDAAVAVGFALAVTLPRAGNIGGDGFMLVHDAKSCDAVPLSRRSGKGI